MRSGSCLRPAALIRTRSCRIDDEIFEHTLKTFPELAENNHAKLVKLDEEGMKSPDGKERWRVFIESYVVPCARGLFPQ